MVRGSTPPRVRVGCRSPCHEAVSLLYIGCGHGDHRVIGEAAPAT